MDAISYPTTATQLDPVITKLSGVMTGHRKNKILIVAYPTQGHINPALRFATRLLHLGVHVTFSTTLSVIRRIHAQTTHHALTLAPFPDCQQPAPILLQFYSDVATNGVCAIKDIITSAAAAGQPFDHLVYTVVVPWAATVANTHGLESTLLWCQPATVFCIYYYYFNGYQDLISSNNNNNPTFAINLPNLPSLTTADVPSLLSPDLPEEHQFIVQMLKDHIDVVKISPRILVNTFEELEIESIKAIENVTMLPVGPLVPSNDSFTCDLFEKPEEDYMKWLNKQAKSSVVYVSFGSMVSLLLDQAEEIGLGLVESGRPFLWVVKDSGQVVELSNIEVLKKQGVIVSWCDQVEVLNHEAIGCFVSHCGWNSSMEALVAGVGIVGFPQWADQATNGKMVEDVWKTGVMVKRQEGDGVVEGKEVKRCVEMVMEDGEMRRNAEKWRELARRALVNGGSSAVNLRAFVDDA